MYYLCLGITYSFISFYSQQQLDNALYGYTSQSWSQGTCTHALSGLKVGEISHGIIAFTETVQSLHNTPRYSKNLDRRQSCYGFRILKPWNVTRKLWENDHDQ